MIGTVGGAILGEGTGNIELAMDGYYGLKQHGYDRTIRMLVQ